MDVEEIRQMSDEELEAELTELREELANLRMQQSVTTLENPMQLRNLRRDIARILTIKQEREEEEEAHSES